MFILNEPSLMEIIALYISFSLEEIRSLSKRKLKRLASLPITSTKRYFASSKLSPSTFFKVMKTTGYLPINELHSCLFSEIYNPSNKEGFAPISRKHLSILILRVLPNRRGRVKRFTLPPLANSCSISFVLST